MLRSIIIGVPLPGGLACSQAAMRSRVRLQVDLNDIESSTILSFRYIVEMGDGLSGLEKRQALKDWLDLLSRSHPLNR